MTTENNKTLKLNYKNTFLIACSFFSITLLWTVYNQYCPKIIEAVLINRFPDTYQTTTDTLFIVGIIMALDNLFALFMLPIFGTLSDKTKCKFGKRMIYIFPGMVVSALIFPLISLFFIIAPSNITLVVIMMGLVLIIMNIYRNPAVALMPDVTPKPLRSKANSIINFVGYIGGIIGGALMMVFGFKNDGMIALEHAHLVSFLIASFFMIAAALILVFTIKENKILKETEADMIEGEKQSETIANVEDGQPLTKEDKKNMFVLLFGILFWFFSFNALESFNSLFCQNVLGGNYSGTIVIILTVSSLIAFIAFLNLPSKIGRKNTILIGIGLITIAFVSCTIILLANGVFKPDYNPTSETWKTKVIWIYLCIALVGIGWALINANSYPMMVELSSSKNIGKYTGLYYTFSMIAQTITPILAGAWMRFDASGYGLKLLFVYGAIMIIIAGVIMFFFKENRKNVKVNKSISESLDN